MFRRLRLHRSGPVARSQQIRRGGAIAASLLVLVVLAINPASAAKPAPEKIFSLEIWPNNLPAGCNTSTGVGCSTVTWGNNLKSGPVQYNAASTVLTAKLYNRTPGNSNFSSFDVTVPADFAIVSTAKTAVQTNPNAGYTISRPSTNVVRVTGLDPVNTNQFAAVDIGVRVQTNPACSATASDSAKWAAKAYAGNISSTTFRQLTENAVDGGAPIYQSSHFLTTSIQRPCNAAPMASSVNITGTAAVGQVLTGHYTYTDAENDVEGTSTFRWLRNGDAIIGATSSTYTLASEDAGQSITFEVTPVAATGTSPGTAVTSSGVTVNAFPVASGVNITGTPHVGLDLTGHYTYSDAETDAEGASTFRWLRNGDAIIGATSSTYTLVSDDSGQVITFEVTPVASAGSSPGAPATSAGVTVATLTSLPCGESTSVGDEDQVTITNRNSGGTECQSADFTATFDGGQLDIDKATSDETLNLEVVVDAFDPERAVNPIPASRVKPPLPLHDGLWCNGTDANPTMPGSEVWCLISQSSHTYGPDGNPTDWVPNYNGQLIQVSETWLLQGDATLCRTCK